MISFARCGHWCSCTRVSQRLLHRMSVQLPVSLISNRFLRHSVSFQASNEQHMRLTRRDLAWYAFHFTVVLVVDVLLKQPLCARAGESSDARSSEGR